MIQLAPVPVVLALGIGLVRYHQLRRGLRLLVWLIGFVLILEVITRVLREQHRPNLFLMPIYTVGEFCLLALVYREALQSAFFSRLMPWLVGSFTIYALFDSLQTSLPTQFRPGQQVVQSVLVLLIVGAYFRKLLNELVVRRLEQEPMFWISTGLFIYFLGYVQIALFSNYLLRYSKELNLTIWAVHALLYMLLYSCYSLALWMRPQK
ncbi:hypothetical protein [Hymenobacter negativus]|uniref:Uncharacterized protein n=1 Tax=Hymenobacter negativus TaxID=2795026 RepID=A0ABS3QIC5_9BACT|nr:hypothetical protein [Hymenobacter negativus]MBO2010984.1 hypothetical protein [Hymenobacter negativus]